MPWKTTNVMNQRIEFALKSLKTSNFRELCRDYGISTKTGYKWQKRLLEHGTGGMEEQSRRPRSSPEQLGEGVVCEIVRLKRRHPAWGPRKIREIYLWAHGNTPSESSFKRVLEAAGLTEKKRVRRAKKGGRITNGLKAKAPNEVWTVDFKGWWHDPEGRRCEPLTVRDEHSRYILELRALANARTETVRGCFERLFEKHGLPGAIRSDNGSPFASTSAVLGLSRLSAWWAALGIDLERGRPGCPQDNGAHERMHLDISRELEGSAPGERQSAFEVWRESFNRERPHEALEMRTPAEVYTSSERKYEGTPDELDYGAMETRRVHVTGRITWKNCPVRISSALQGWSVGLEPAEGAEGDYFNVWFASLLLGELETSTASFLPSQRGQGGTATGHSADSATLRRPNGRDVACGADNQTSNL